MGVFNLHRASKCMQTFHKHFSVRSLPQTPYSYITLYGDPVLRKKCRVVTQEEIKTAEIQKLLRQMVSIMRQADIVGLAAPQIGVPLQIIVLEFTDRQMLPPEKSCVREMKTFPLKIFINPKLTVTDSREVKFKESCASVPYNGGVIPRAYGVKVTGLNENGNSVSWNATGWPARVLQHEVDHLNGKLNIDIINKHKTFMDSLKNWLKYIKMACRVKS